MVKTGTERSDKYAAKFDAEVVRARYTATAEIAKAKQSAKTNLLAQKAAAVRTILNTLGIAPILSAMYQAYSNKLAAICFRLAGFGTEPTYSLAARNQALPQANVWEMYGADEDAMFLIWDEYKTMLGDPPSPLPYSP